MLNSNQLLYKIYETILAKYVNINIYFVNQCLEEIFTFLSGKGKWQSNK